MEFFQECLHGLLQKIFQGFIKITLREFLPNLFLHPLLRKLSYCQQAEVFWQLINRFLQIFFFIDSFNYFENYFSGYCKKFPRDCVKNSYRYSLTNSSWDSGYASGILLEILKGTSTIFIAGSSRSSSRNSSRNVSTKFLQIFQYVFP